MKPDAMTVAKALGGGLPIGALITGERLADVLVAGDHGSTFAGGPVIASAALAALEVTDDPALLKRVRELGQRLAGGLEGLPHVTAVRGRGLMLACELDVSAPAVVRRALLEQQLVLNATGAKHAAAAAAADPHARPTSTRRSRGSRSRWRAERMRRELADGFELDDDPQRIDVDAVHAFISGESYWGQGRPREHVEQGDPRLAQGGRALPRRRAGRLRQGDLRRRDPRVPGRRVRASGAPRSRARTGAGARDRRRRASG